MRVAGRVAGQRIGAAASAPASATASNPAPNPGKATGKAARSLARGVGGFLRPFHRIGGILWLEVTGAFFLFFACALIPALLRTRPVHVSGPYDRSFVAAAIIAAVFLYLGVSSFWRVRKR